jgi:hypothetical protein
VWSNLPPVNINQFLFSVVNGKWISGFWAGALRSFHQHHQGPNVVVSVAPKPEQPRLKQWATFLSMTAQFFRHLSIF